MKKLLLVLMMSFAACNAQARAIKLGDAASDVGTGTSVVKKRVCTSNSQCITSLCLEGKCVRCNNEDKKCPDGQVCQVSGVCVPGYSCHSSDECDYGYKCVSGNCSLCSAGDPECHCPSGAKADGRGGCVCPDDSFSYDGRCIKYCAYTACKSGYTPTYDGMTGCCCR